MNNCPSFPSFHLNSLQINCSQQLIIHNNKKMYLNSHQDWYRFRGSRNFKRRRFKKKKKLQNITYANNSILTRSTTSFGGNVFHQQNLSSSSRHIFISDQQYNIRTLTNKTLWNNYHRCRCHVSEPQDTEAFSRDFLSARGRPPQFHSTVIPPFQ